MGLTTPGPIDDGCTAGSSGLTKTGSDGPYTSTSSNPEQNNRDKYCDNIREQRFN